MDVRTDTSSYRDARTHLKRVQMFFFLNPLSLRLQTLETVFSVVSLSCDDLSVILKKTDLRGSEEVKFPLQFLIDKVVVSSAAAAATATRLRSNFFGCSSGHSS